LLAKPAVGSKHGVLSRHSIDTCCLGLLCIWTAMFSNSRDLRGF
jgi:hypothetical protein